MPLIDAQRRMTRVGTIRLGNKVPTGKTNRRGEEILKPNKLDTFRVTTPYENAAREIARLYGGTVANWHSQRGPEFEVITASHELPVLVPRQRIDPNYEMWGKNLRQRLCDGGTERVRNTPCLCKQWDNHQHKYSDGDCSICGVAERWGGEPHTHDYDMGICVTCGCHRPCKPTTRLSLLIKGVPGAGVFKLESHGFNAAVELPALAGVIEEIDTPLLATLGLRYEHTNKIVIVDGREKIQTRQYYVPELRFDWVIPEALFSRAALAEASRTALDTPVLNALTSTPEPVPEPLTTEDILHVALTSTTVEALRELWKIAGQAGILDDSLKRILAGRREELKRLAVSSEVPTSVEVIDAEIIED